MRDDRAIVRAAQGIADDLEQAFGRVTHARAVALGVDEDALGHVQVRRPVHVDVAVADARIRTMLTLLPAPKLMASLHPS